MANVDGMVSEAIRAYKNGKKDEAQALLIKATELDETNEKAWMWLSAVVDSIEDQMVCLENVLIINPDNKDAQRGLEILKKKAASQPKQASPFTDFSDDWGDIDADTSGFMADLEVDPPAYGEKSATPAFVAEEPADEYSNTFDDAFTDIGFDTDYEDDFDSFGDALFDESDFEAEIDPPSDLDLTSGPFGTTLDFEEAQPQEATDEFDDLFEDAFEPEPEPIRSPVSPMPDPEPTGDVFFSTEKPQTTQNEDDFSAYFAQIPARIKPTRLPGSKGTKSFLMRLGVIILSLANMLAAILLVLNLVG
ncbi:MAG: hypothetical protein CUN56_12360 [Phototrophicales bacterium]|nr:MAG: hypothetical protein CUN56_12360 [Phototrophicales bacterium]RMG71187.1 MAG: hypothetical protein D6711_15845 [Chloroflexota bacterium]